jgi:hypothetical protein
MVKMVRSRREWKCSSCSATQIKWEGTCRACGATATLEEVTLIDGPEKKRETTAAKRLRRRAKDSERGIAKRMSAIDGPDPAFSNIASSTGRIGHITGIRVDAVSLNYVTENKNRKIPSWMAAAWILINQRATDFNKNALLHVDPPNLPKTIPVNGKQQKLDTLAIITQTRHEELIRKEKAVKMLLEIVESLPASDDLLTEVFETLLEPNNTKI